MTAGGIGLGGAWRAGRDAIDALPPREQAALLTVPMLLLYGASAWYVAAPVSILAVAVLVVPSLRTSTPAWYTMACLQLAGVAVDWSTSDNHKYLIAYWTLAIALAGLGEADDLRAAARRLVGLTFSFALVWKALSPDFASGTFFEHTLLFDDRFQVRATATGLLPAEVVHLDRVARAALLDPASDLAAVRVATTPVAHALAWLFTGWMVVTELAIAVLFLAPPGWRAARWREAWLVSFVALAYGIAPVLGFGSVLSAMGFVQCEVERRRTRSALLLTFILLQVFQIPWADLLTRAPG